MQQFTHHMVTMSNGSFNPGFIHLDESVHLYQILMSYLNGRLTPGSVNCLVRQIAKKELYRNSFLDTTNLIHSNTTHHLSHPTNTNRLGRCVNLIVNVGITNIRSP